MSPAASFLKFIDQTGKTVTAHDVGAVFHGVPVLALSGGGFASVDHIMQSNRIVGSICAGKHEGDTK